MEYKLHTEYNMIQKWPFWTTGYNSEEILLFVYLLPHGLMIMWTRIWDMTKTRAFVTEICTILLQQVRILYLHNQCIHAISRKLAMFDVVLNILF